MAIKSTLQSPSPRCTCLTMVLVSLLCLSLPTRADDSSTEIGALLSQVAQSGCEFRRNGSVHSAEDAADHLRLKYRRGKRYVNSTEQFIDRLASESSWTGKAYSVICDGVERPSRDWLYEALASLRAPE